MRLFMIAPLMAFVGLCGFTRLSFAMDLQMGDRLPILVQSDLTLDPNGKSVQISGPWLTQTLSIVNTDTTYTLRIDTILAEASCLDGSNEDYVPVYSPNFDIDAVGAELPVGGPSFDTGDLYIHHLPQCSNGNVVHLEVEGSLIDANGDEQDWEDSSVIFITR